MQSLPGCAWWTQSPAAQDLSSQCTTPQFRPLDNLRRPTTDPQLVSCRAGLGRELQRSPKRRRLATTADFSAWACDQVSIKALENQAPTQRRLEQQRWDQGMHLCMAAYAFCEAIAQVGGRLDRGQEHRRTRQYWLTKCRHFAGSTLEDLCDLHVTHKCFFHLDAIAGSVLDSHEFGVNLHKRLGNRSSVGGPCRLYGAFLAPQLEHSETCSTAEATRWHYACVNAL